MFRQGDLLIVPLPEAGGILGIPADLKPERSNVVQLGEATGHAHRLVGGDVFANGNFLRVANGTAQLTHDEHDTITLPEGEYLVRRQREFTGTEGGIDTWSGISD